MGRFWAILLCCGAAAASARAAEPLPVPTEGDYIVRDFRLESGATFPELRLHYTTFGHPERDPDGHVTNAVLLLHSTGGDSHQFLRPQFAGELFGTGQPLDVTKYYVIVPDAIGHGHSAKPSDGLHTHFPDYAYADMVAAQYRVVTEALHVDHVRLVLGASMGCMHTFLWGERYPGFMDALMPLACLPVQIAGRNRMWRRMIIDAIREDPAWQGGEYKEPPQAALRTVSDVFLLAGSAPLPMQLAYPTRDQADAHLDEYTKESLATLDANDVLYQVAASRDYDPSPQLEAIRARVLWINFSDDFINPPELGIAEAASKRLAHGRFVLHPLGPGTHGHSSHTWAALWKSELSTLLAEIAAR